MANISLESRLILNSYLSNKSSRFDFLRIGRLCNGSRSFCFSDAYCDLEQIESPRLLGVPLSIRMDLLFDRAIEILHAQRSERRIALSHEESRALESLHDFLLKIDIHEKCLLNAFEKMKTDPSKEAVLSLALSEHLFSPLESGYSYILDDRLQGKDPSTTCKCGCNNHVNFDATGIGHHKVWHGFADIMIKDTGDPILAARVVARPVVFKGGGECGPSTAKKSKSEDDEKLSKSSDLEVELKRKDRWDQIIAQTIVFALAQRQRNPSCRKFIPNIFINQEQFYIIMYDPENDVLMWSGAFRLWSSLSPTTLNKYAVITLWMVIHYRLFCHGADTCVFENLLEVKAGFLDCIEDEKKEYYQQLAIGVSNFETEEVNFLTRGHTISDMFENVEVKLKIRH